MALNYDAITTGSALSADLAANSSLSPEALQAISDILSLDTATSVGVATLNSTSITMPVTQGTDAVIGIFSGAAGTNVNVAVPQFVEDTAKAYVFNSDANLTLDFSPVESVIASGNGNDKITVSGGENIVLDGGNGNDTLVTTSGNDTVIGGNGNDSLNTGSGNDVLLGGAGKDTLVAGSGDDSISGGDGNDSISAGAGNDTIVAGQGQDLIDGGSGYDVIRIVDASSSDYDFNSLSSVVVATSKDGSASIVSTNAEIFSFGTDGTDNMFIVNNQDDANALRLYTGLLGRSPDVEGAKFWLDSLDQGQTVTGVADGFLASTEFQNALTTFQETTGESGNTAYVDLLYQNILGRAADQSGKDFWVSALDNGATQADVAIAIVGAPETDTVDSVVVIDGQIV